MNKLLQRRLASPHLMIHTALQAMISLARMKFWNRLNTCTEVTVMHCMTCNAFARPANLQIFCNFLLCVRLQCAVAQTCSAARQNVYKDSK